MDSPSSTLFAAIVSAGQKRERAKETRQARENSAQRLTWMSSQQSQSETFERDSHADRSEDDLVLEASKELKSLIGNLNQRLLEQIVSERSNSTEFVGFTRAVLDTLGSNKNEETARLAILYYEILLQHFRAGRDVIRRSDLFAELLLRISVLPDHALAFIANKAFDSCIKNDDKQQSIEMSRELQSSILELGCKLVLRVRSFPKGSLDRQRLCDTDIDDLDGEGFRSYTVLRVCRSHWPKSAIVVMLTALGDLCLDPSVNLSNEAIDAVDAKLLKQLENPIMTDVPQIAVSILNLSSILPNLKQIILYIIDFMERHELDDGFVHIWGQILSKICSIVAQDARLGTEVIKVVSDSTEWSSTNLSLLLTIQRVRRFESQIVDLIRKRVLNMAVGSTLQGQLSVSFAAGEEENTASSQPEARARVSLTTLTENLLDVCTYAEKGNWDLIVPALVKTCLRLADEDDTFSSDCHPYFDLQWELPSGRCSAQTLVSSLGLRVLTRCYRLFALTRFDLHTTIVDRALSSENGKGALPVIRLLFSICRDSVCSRVFFTEHASNVKDLITILPNVMPRIAHGILKAIGPGLYLGTLYQDIRDYAMLVFRKTLFQRDLAPRVVGLLGILTCCQISPNSGIADQTDQLDALGCLRRCLSQQYEMRFALYRALAQFPAKFKQDLLTGHVQTFLDATDDKDLSPIFFERCINQSTGRIVEPVSTLISALTAGSEKDGWFSESHAKRLSEAALTTFSLDKESSFDPSEVSGIANRSSVTLIIETCEVMIDVFIRRGLNQQDTNNNNLAESPMMQKVAALFRLHRAMHRLVEMWDSKDAARTEAYSGKGAKGGKKKKLKSMGENEEKDENDLTAADGQINVKIDFPMPLMGEYLSDETLIRLLAIAQQIPDSTIIELHHAAGNSEAAPGQSRFDVNGLLAGFGYHHSMLQALGNRIRKLRRIALGSRMEMNNSSEKSNGNFRGARSGSNQASSLNASTIAELAESCSGTELHSPMKVCADLSKVLIKLLVKYISLAALLNTTTDHGTENSDVGKEQSTNTKSKKRVSSEPATSSSEANSRWKVRRWQTSAALELKVTVLQHLRDCLEVAALCGSDCLVSVVKVMSRFNKPHESEPVWTVRDNVEDNSIGQNDRVLIRAALHIHDIAANLLSHKEATAGTVPCLEMIRCLMSHVSGEDSTEGTGIVAKLLGTLIEMYDAGSVAITRVFFKLFLDLSAKAGDFPGAFETMGQWAMNGSTFSSSKAKLAAKKAPMEVQDSQQTVESAHLGPQPDSPVMIRGVTNATAAVETLLQALNFHGVSECERALTIHSLQVLTHEASQIRFVKLLHGIFSVLFVLLDGPAVKGSVNDQSLRCVVRSFKCAIKLFRSITLKRMVAAPESIEEFAKFISNDFTKRLDECLRQLEQGHSKDSKVVVEVVFVLEQYEVLLLKASKCCVALNGIGKYAKRVTARDFKLDAKALVEALEKNDGGNGEAEEEEEE